VRLDSNPSAAKKKTIKKNLCVCMCVHVHVHVKKKKAFLPWSSIHTNPVPVTQREDDMSEFCCPSGSSATGATLGSKLGEKNKRNLKIKQNGKFPVQVSSLSFDFLP
jgi:hypothetical protein